MVNTVAPVWDGNETWLVLGGAGLLAAFPLAYSVLLSALYIPLVLMLMGLILRGVAFEFRFKADEAHRPFWDIAFAGGSYVATFFQGAALGAFIDGFTVTGPSYDGGALDWLRRSACSPALGLIVAYALLGSTWLTMKTEGALQGRMIGYARRIVPVLLIGIIIVSIWTPLAHSAIARRWFSLPDIFFFAPVPILVLVTSWRLLRLLNGGSDGNDPTVPDRSCWRCSCCSWAIAAWRSACGRTSSRPACRSATRRAAAEPGFRAGRRTADHPDHPDLHRLGLLRVPRQGDGEGGIPLMWGRRVLWLVAIWSASVLALGVAALLMRGLMGVAGLTG